MFLVGDLYKPSFATVTGKGPPPKYIHEHSFTIFHHDLNNPVEDDSVKSHHILHNFQSSEFLLQKRPKKATESTFPG